MENIEPPAQRIASGYLPPRKDGERNRIQGRYAEENRGQTVPPLTARDWNQIRANTITKLTKEMPTKSMPVALKAEYDKAFSEAQWEGQQNTVKDVPGPGLFSQAKTSLALTTALFSAASAPAFLGPEFSWIPAQQLWAAVAVTATYSMSCVVARKIRTRARLSLMARASDRFEEALRRGSLIPDEVISAERQELYNRLKENTSAISLK